MGELLLQSNERIYQKFTREDEKFIQNNYLVHTDHWIGDRIGRHKNSIRNKRAEMGCMKYEVCIKLKPSVVPPKEHEVKLEIQALVHFIETTSSQIWQQIAYTRYKQLKDILNKTI